MFGGEDEATSTGSAEMAFWALQNVNCIHIKEKASVVEAATAMLGQEIEMANKYKIKDKETGQELFYAVERTGCCGRQMKQCFPDCAAWNLDIMFTGNGQMTKVLQMQRDFTCTCCCCNRPVVNIKDAQTGALIGAVKDPWTCCDLTFTVKDPDMKDIVAAHGGCCQWGLCCPCPCGPCSRVEFDLKDKETGDSIGTLTKKVPGVLKFLFAPDVDNYLVEFDKTKDVKPKTKALMIALSIFMDFRVFSDNPNDDEGVSNS